MKLLTFRKDGRTSLGLIAEQGILDVAAAAARFTPEEAIPSSVDEAVHGGTIALQTLTRLLQNAVSDDAPDVWLNESKLTYGPCVTNPSKIICVGLNYRKHAEETGASIPQYPILFNKFNNTLSSHRADIHLPAVSEKVDYEAELAVVIGRKAKDVSREQALEHVFGYCNVNDLSARDLQMRTSQWLLGKSCDGFSPLGPYLVTADEVVDPNRLGIRCMVNGELRQNSNTSDMIFHCDEIISYISWHMTLEPGDVILTGTPEGVVLGHPEDKQVYLKDGDVVTIEIEKLGTLSNRMVAESW